MKAILRSGFLRWPSWHSRADGIYIWQVTVATDELIEVHDKGLRSGSSKSSSYRRIAPGTITINKGTAESGSFRVQSGSILPRSKVTEK